jgi:predicted MFS family arabinose efflux permease
MLGLFRERPAVRRRALYQVFLFAAFNMLWTAAPIMLAERFGLSTEGIAAFALAGAGGALAAPVAGRLADRGLVRATTAGAMIVLALSFLSTIWAVAAALMALLVIATILIDAAVQANQVVSQRVIFAVPSEIRGRVNAIYMTLTFGGGAAGSVLGTVTYHWGGWDATAGAGALMGALALAFFATERRP